LSSRNSLVVTAVLALVLAAGCTGPPPEPTPPVPGPTPGASNCPTFKPASAGLPTENEWKSIPSVGDVNRDGLADFAVLPRKQNGPRVYLSDGMGGWKDTSEPLRYPSAISCGVGTRLKDIDRDGHVDLLVADHCQGIYVFRGDGAGGWTPDSQGIPRNVQGFNDADAGDLDGDGYTDIVALSAFSSGFMVLRGGPRGSWTVWPDSGLPASGLGFSVRLVDVNGDGRLDVITSFQPVLGDRRTVPPPHAKVWLNDPSGRFRPASGFPNRGRFFSVDVWRRPGRAIPDLVTALSGARGGIWRFESEDAERWTEVGRVDNAGFPAEGALFVGLDVTDMNADGCADLVTSEGTTGKVWLALGDCEGGWAFCPEATFPQDAKLPPWGVATADFNGDGRRDVVAAFGKGPLGGVHVWFQTEAAPVSR
jgi:hypothetical protein